MSKPTPPKPWPNHAENHRLDAMACQMEADKLIAQAQEAIAHGRVFVADVLLQRARKQIDSAQDYLRAARDARPNEPKDEIDRIEAMWDEEEE